MNKELATQGKLRGIETMETRDMLIPRVLLVQKTSKFVDDLGAKPGTFWNSLTKTEITDTTFIPVIFHKYWDLLMPDPKSDRMKFDKRVFQEPDGRKFYKDDEGPADATAVLSFISLFGSRLMLLPFSKSSYVAGKTLLTMVCEKKKDLFAYKYKLSSAKKSNGDNVWYVIDVNEAGEVTPEEYSAAELAYASLGKKTLESAGLEGEKLEDVPF